MYLCREIDDATAVMTIVMLIFIIPAKPMLWWSKNVGGNSVHYFLNFVLKTLLIVMQ